MNTSRLFLFALFVIYTLALMGIEATTSQDYVRNYFTDIEGPVFFYAINTTFSTSLLWLTALLFGVCLLLIDKQQQRQDYLFYWSQIIMFTYLGFDDRFTFHETVGLWIRHNDAYLVIAMGLLEIIFLTTLGNLSKRPRPVRNYLYSGALLFAIMVVIDAKFPSQMFLRLSLEDLSKLWACLCLTLFAWEILIQEINRFKTKV
jgi:hypothetical protein